MCTMHYSVQLPRFLLLCLAMLSPGCRSPYYADRGAFGGGLAGAGIGAIVGNSVGNPVAGTAIGAGIGALTGGAIGGAMDDLAAQNRAEIATHLGRPVAQGAATVEEVVAMSRAGVDPRLIANYVNNSGVSRPISAQDVIYLSQQGVATDVIDVMQRPVVAAVPQPVRVAQQPAPVIVEQFHYGEPYCYPPRHHYYYHHRPHHPRVGFGVSFSN